MERQLTGTASSSVGVPKLKLRSPDLVASTLTHSPSHQLHHCFTKWVFSSSKSILYASTRYTGNEPVGHTQCVNFSFLPLPFSPSFSPVRKLERTSQKSCVTCPCRVSHVIMLSSSPPFSFPDRVSPCTGPGWPQTPEIDLPQCPDPYLHFRHAHTP